MQTKCEHTGESPCDRGSDQSDGDQGGEQTVSHVASASQTAAEDNLGNLEEDDDDDIFGNQNAHIQNGEVRKEERDQVSSEEEQDDCQYKLDA